MERPTHPDIGPVYGVWADQSTLRREALGPLFGRISLELRGTLDGHWAESYMAVRKDTEQFSRFNLDLKASRVSFTFRATETPAEVQDLLKRLTLLLELANLQATSAASHRAQGQTGA
jgi:hypothetical protein